MFKNYYKIRITGRDVKRFLKSLYKRGIFFQNIIINKNEAIVVVDYINYKKIMEVKTTYKINVTRVFGFNYIKKTIKRNIIFLSFFLFGIILLFILSNIIFDVEIVSDDKNIVKLLRDELDKYNIKKYKHVLSFDEVSKIKENIINSNKDKIEWMEIERIGTKYVIKLEKRIKNDVKEEDPIRHVIAKKSGIIKKIVASNGEIVKKINDYVKKGDILISGEIHKGEDIKNNISADGSVYAEVWYKVKVALPINYYEEKYSGNSKNNINIKFIDEDVNMFSSYKNKEIKKNNIYSDFFGLFEINYNFEKEKEIIDDVNLMTNENLGVILAREKIESILKENEYIISQKKLKTTLNNSTINIEVFFKVYENISEYKYYEINEGL